MSHDDKNINATIDDREIDLLVDGELADERRRKLLAELDVKPGGWRRCALAFLENQCWRQSCASLGEDTTSLPATPTASAEQKTRPAAKKSGKISRQRPSAVARAAGALLAMSACFFFGAGLMSLIGNAKKGDGSDDVIHGAMYATPTNPEDGTLVHGKNIVMPDKYITVELAAKHPDGTKSTIKIPALVQNNIDAARLRELPPAIPPELVRSFEKAGHDVHQTRRLVPFRMEDGRRLVVPVDQLDVHYVDMPYYQ